MAKKLKNLMISFTKHLLTKWIEDFFIFLGIAIMIGTTYMKFGLVVGNYSLAIVFMLFGFLIAKK